MKNHYLQNAFFFQEHEILLTCFTKPTTHNQEHDRNSSVLHLKVKWTLVDIVFQWSRDIYEPRVSCLCPTKLVNYISAQHISPIKASSWHFTLNQGWSVGEQSSDNDFWRFREITELYQINLRIFKPSEAIFVNSFHSLCMIPHSKFDSQCLFISHLDAADEHWHLLGNNVLKKVKTIWCLFSDLVETDDLRRGSDLNSNQLRANVVASE